MNSFNEILADIKIINCENVISCGYNAIIHYCGKEYEITFNKIKNKKFLKKLDKNQCVLHSSSIIDATYLSRRFLIRNNLLTIGYGTIIDVKYTQGYT
jgi:translation elongation factor EF-1alpha